MTMYVVNIILLITYAAVLLWIRPTPGKRKMFCALGAVNWIVLSGLRHPIIGADTYAYRYAFYNSKYKTWTELFENFRNTIFNWNLVEDGVMNSSTGAENGVFDMLMGENAMAVKDPGYALFNKLCYEICPDYTVFLFIIAIIFMVPLAVLIYKHSSEPLMSYLIYSCLFFSFFSITGHRQTIATGIALSAYMLFAERKKFIPFLLMILIAYPLHKSVLGFIPIYFLQYIKMDRKKVILTLLVFPVVFVLRQQITTLLVFLSGYEGYDQMEGGGAVTFMLVYIVLMLVTTWKCEETLCSNPKANIALVAIAVAFVLVPTTFINANMMRLVQYYSIFLVLYIPDLIMAFNKKECIFAYFGATSLLLFLLFKNNPQYMFFWQDTILNVKNILDIR